VANNPERIRKVIAKYKLNLDPNDPTLPKSSNRQQTFINRRRDIANLLQLQINGLLWAATGVDQYYPKNYEHAQIDLDADDHFHELTPDVSLQDVLSFDILDAGMLAAHVPTILINEPILVSNGLNSDIRYNFFYPRWAYDQYRQLLNERSAAYGWKYVDLWNLVPMDQFTNSGVHLTPYGESLLAAKTATAIQETCK
jgi:hypothetical protein